MIPRHPGDPERLPKVSKERVAPCAGGAAAGLALVWGQQVPWEGGYQTLQTCAKGQASRRGEPPGLRLAASEVSEG